MTPLTQVDQLINNQMAWEGQRPAREENQPSQSAFPERSYLEPQLPARPFQCAGFPGTLPTRLRRQSGSFKYDDVRLAMVAEQVPSPHMPHHLRRPSAFDLLAPDNGEQ